MFPRRYEHRHKKLFSGFVSYQTFLVNVPSKDNQETAKATRRSLLNEYLNKVSTMTVPSTIFEFWRERRREFPSLFTLSTHALCVPASSTSVKRLCSASGLILRPQRARLSSEMLEIPVYLKCYSNFLEKKIGLTWCYRFIFKRPNDCRSRSWSRSRTKSLGKHPVLVSKKLSDLGLGLGLKACGLDYNTGIV